MLARVRVSSPASLITTTIISARASEAPARFKGSTCRALIEQKSSTEVSWVKSGVLWPLIMGHHSLLILGGTSRWGWEGRLRCRVGG